MDYYCGKNTLNFGVDPTHFGFLMQDISSDEYCMPWFMHLDIKHVPYMWLDFSDLDFWLLELKLLGHGV